MRNQNHCLPASLRSPFRAVLPSKQSGEASFYATGTAGVSEQYSRSLPPLPRGG